MWSPGSAAGDLLSLPTESEHVLMSDLDPAVPAEPEGDTLTDTGTQSAGLDGYTPREIVANDLGNVSLEDAISGTIVEFDDGDIV